MTINRLNAPAGKAPHERTHGLIFRATRFLSDSDSDALLKFLRSVVKPAQPVDENTINLWGLGWMRVTAVEIMRVEETHG